MVLDRTPVGVSAPGERCDWLAPVWELPPSPPCLHRDEVHIWRARLNQSPDYLEQLAATLRPDELQRAGRFHFARDRGQFVAARGILRRILGGYLDVEPRSLQFGYGIAGKPFLIEPGPATPLQFNVSHAEDLALYAVSRDRAVGVDVERVRPVDGLMQVAAHFFSAQERRALQRLGAEAQDEAFFTCWTRKEACVKAWGDGLSFPLDEFAVSLSPDRPAELVWIKEGAESEEEWRLQHLVPEVGYVGAVAVPGRDVRLKCYSWTPGPGTVLST